MPSLILTIQETPTSPVAPFIHDNPLQTHSISSPHLPVLDPKYKPIRPSESGKYVWVTVNNEYFLSVNISEASTVEEVKIMISNRLNIQDWSLCTFHLTDSGCKEGQALDDYTFSQLMFNPSSLGFTHETLKIFVTYIPGFESSLSHLSLDYAVTANTRQQPPIPAPQKPYVEPPPLQNPQWQHFKIPGYQTKNGKLADSKGNFTDEMESMPLSFNAKASMGSIFEYNSRRTSEDSFKVIRPERKEINFDDRRSSPYDRWPSFNPRQNSVLNQHVTLPPIAAEPAQANAGGPQPLQRMPSTLERTPPAQLTRMPSKHEREPHLVAKRSAPPPPPGTIQRINSTRSVKNDETPSGPTAVTRKRVVSRRKLNAPGAVTDSTNKLVKQMPMGSQRVTSGPPRIDLEELNSPALSEELGFGFNDNKAAPTTTTTTTAAAASRPKSVLRKANDKKFHENEVSFEGAPAFEEDSDDSSDGGLWAKKPPVKTEKPQLHVATNILDDENNPDSPIYGKKTNSSLSDIKVGGWAVRPPAEVVYENLERFFPGADLDKPILFDQQGSSPPSSPGIEQTTGRSRYPLSPVVEPSRTDKSSKGATESTPSYHQPVEKSASQLAQLADAASNSTDISGLHALARMNNSRGLGVSDSTGGAGAPNYPISAGKGMSMRPKSLRIVVQEATERRKRFQSLANDGGSKSGALVRRKSTKMWGQRVVEVKPNDMKRGQLSRLRDNRGKEKQFVWVKGELIGKGSFGKVYLALNATAGEMIAVKQVEVPQTLSDKSSAKQKEMIDTLHAEVETMKDLDHFNIVQYLGFEALPDVYNLFLEYVPGGSVGSALRKHGRFEEAVTKSLTSQVLDALAYLHSCGILHRDLKSDNLLIDLDGVCKISDFGISKKSRDIYTNDAEMSMQGTIFWMAPEVIHNVVANAKQGYSAKVDIWSLGCVILEMFAGRRPWSTDEAIGAMYKLGNARLAPPIPEDTIAFVSEDGKDLIDKCFTIDPELRPTASELLLHPFCKIPRNFRFQDTQLAQMIRVNDKRIGKDSV